MRVADLDLNDGRSWRFPFRRTLRRDAAFHNRWRERRRTLRRCSPRLSSPGEQLLRRYAMSTRDLRDDRIRSERLFNRLRLLFVGPATPPARAADNLNATRHSRFRVRRKTKSRHKPISKSENQTRRSYIQTEGVSRTPLTPVLRTASLQIALRLAAHSDTAAPSSRIAAPVNLTVPIRNFSSLGSGLID